MSDYGKKPAHPDVKLGMELSAMAADLARDARERIEISLDQHDIPVPPGLAELHRAIAEKSLKQVNTCIRQGVDVNALHPNSELGFPLSHALDVGDLRILRALLKAGANPNIEDCIATSIEENSLSLAKLLIEFGADIEGQPTWEKDDDFETNLIRATRLNRPKLVKLLLEAGANPNRRDGNGESALFVARMNKNKRLIKLLEPYVSEDERAWVEERFSHAYAERLKLDKEIYDAIHAGQVEQVKEILSATHRPLDAALDPEFGFPLEEAIESYFKAQIATCPEPTPEQKLAGRKYGTPDYNHPSVIKMRNFIRWLLDHGAPVDQGGWRTPLAIMSAVRENEPDINLTLEMVAKLADIDSPLMSSGDTLLMKAAHGRNVTLTKAALNRGANPNISDSYGESILQKALSSEPFDGPNPCIPLLLEAGAKE